MRASGVRVNASMINQTVPAIVNQFSADIKGFVLANGTQNCHATREEELQRIPAEGRCAGGMWSWAQPASVSAALTLAAASEGLVVAADEQLAGSLTSLGIPLYFDARHARVTDIIERPGVMAALSPDIYIFQDPSKAQFLGDYGLFARAPTLAFGSDSAAQSALLDARGPSGGGKLGAAFGWGPENAYVATCNAHGVYVHASDYCTNLAALSNAPPTAASEHSPALGASTDVTKRVSPPRRHTVAFVMSDGDNLQWVLGPFATDSRWWASPRRGDHPVGWTLSPALSSVAPAALARILATQTEADEMIAGPSGVGYAFPTALAASLRPAFGRLTADAMGRSGMRLVNAIGQNDDPPTSASLGPLLNESAVLGALYYPFGGGYSALEGRMWRLGQSLLVSGRVSLWGEGESGTMLGVQPLIDRLLAMPRTPEVADGYSLIPVHVWSHSLEDVAAVADALQASGGVDVVLPSELLHRIGERVWAASCACDSPGKGTAGHNRYSCSDGAHGYCASDQECFAELSFAKGDWRSGCRAPTTN